MNYLTQSNFDLMEPLSEGIYDGYSIDEDIHMRCFVMLTIPISSGPEDYDMEYVNATYFMRITGVTKTIQSFLDSEIGNCVLDNLKNRVLTEDEIANRGDGSSDPHYYNMNKLDVNRDGMIVIEDDHLPEYAKGVYMHPDLFHAFVIWNGNPLDILSLLNSLVF